MHVGVGMRVRRFRRDSRRESKTGIDMHGTTESNWDNM